MAGPPAHEVPVDQARAGHEAETTHLSGPGEEVAEVRDLEIPSAAGAFAQAKEQFFPLLSYRTGPYAPNGTPWANGKQD